MAIITGNSLGQWYGAHHIFDDIGFIVNRGDKVALVGANGAGKSTLMKLIMNIEHPTQGSVSRARSLRMAYLAQEATFTGGTLLDAAHGAFQHVEAMETEMRALEQSLANSEHPDWEARMERYGDLHARFEHAGGYSAAHVIERTLEGLGFQPNHYDQLLATFSGGQKTRAALAVTLLQDPDVLLLDEPTNHLDLIALQWLEGFLKDWPGTLMVISHDRYFLDQVTTRTWEMTFGRLDDYPGNYSTFLRLKVERLERQQKEYAQAHAHITKEEEIIRRYRSGSRARQAKGREKLLMTYKYGRNGLNNTAIAPVATTAPRQQKTLKLMLDTDARAGDRVITLDGVQAGYHTLSGNLVLATTPRLELDRGTRVALIGPNGTGKTTLLRTITGELPALGGRVELGANVSVGYYAQVHDELNPASTVIEEVHRLKPLEKTERIRTLLGRFLFSGDDMFKRIRDLSGGERSRVALAQLTLRSPNLLVLDEPTNHLDIAAREALEHVLTEFPGSILFVSHDRYFVDALADKLWIVEHGAVFEFQGTFSAYAAEQAAQAKQKRATGQAAIQSATPSPLHQQALNETTRETRAHKRRMETIEREIAELEERQRVLVAEMSAAGARGDRAALTTLSQTYRDVDAMLADRYELWAATVTA